MASFEWLGYQFGAGDLVVLATLFLLEGILSFDNAAILAALVRKLPPEQRRKALLYGLAGAYAFRVTAILLAGVLVENRWLRIVGGAYLVYLAGRHFLRREDAHELRPRTMLGLNAFWSTIVLVETADLVFALDQIVVAVALTPKIPLIVAASLVAILMLRLASLYMIRLMAWFPPLEHLAYAAVAWVGAKLLLADLAGVKVPKALSVGVTFSLLVLPMAVKVVLDRARRRRRSAPEPE